MESLSDSLLTESSLMTINIDDFIGRANSREITFLDDRDTNTTVSMFSEVFK